MIPSAVMTRVARIACALVLCALGCSSDPSGGAGATSGAGGGSASAGAGAGGSGSSGAGGGAAGGTIQSLIASVYAVCPAGTPAPSCPTQVQVIVKGQALAPIDDAEVAVNGAPLASAGAGSYFATAPSYAKSYDVVVTRGAEHVEEKLTGPSDFTFAISPDPPAANAPATLTWDTTNEPTVIAEAHVNDGNDETLTQQGPDSGSMDLPATAFPISGPYGISLVRNAYTASGAWASTVILAHSIKVTVP